MSNIIAENKKEIGIDYNSYKTLFINQVNNQNNLDENEIKYFEYRKINLQRSSRLEKTFTLSRELINEINKIKAPQSWMIITETWCGDSAQSIPILAKAASLNDKINLRIVLRDENLNIMDSYLTNGSRSIPKLVAFDENDNELFQWGPRPQQAQNLMLKMKNDGVPKDEMNKQLHLWYAKDRGNEIEKELIELLKNIKNTNQN
ncbi:MAG TPA: thioredoxin family protein [Ignavibacteriaceae bacterium]|nr:thioredoxin family protein [Ignavibacteriaceae bacterium]